MAPTVASRGSRLQAGVGRLGRAGLDRRALVRRLADQLRQAVPCHGLLLLRTDPTTVLPTDGLVEALPPGLCKPFWDNELLDRDVNKFVTLARRDPPAATLREATGGEPDRSRRYATIYRALGVTDELRVSFADRDGSCWGIAQLTRVAGGIFTAAERDLLAAAAPAVAAVLRAGFPAAAPARVAGLPVGSPPPEDTGSPGGPALVILDAAGEVDAITPEARLWLAELAAASDTGMAPVPEPVYTVAARARAARAGLGCEPACAQVHTAGRGWLHLHATCLDHPAGPSRPGGAVAVVLTPAQAPDLVPLLALGYRLTQREQEVLRFLARGSTTAEMTRQLGISPHTVRDHVKSLFGKVGVRSRAELVARIFTEHYFDQLEANVDRRPAGG
jgi:DNA-binding CsgD family transcriptional regulator